MQTNLQNSFGSVIFALLFSFLDFEIQLNDNDLAIEE
jgi:hypothetical protein